LWETLVLIDQVTGNLLLVEPQSGTLLPVSFNSIFDSVVDLKNRLTGDGAMRGQRKGAIHR
jgi:hypothetical protein